MKQKLIMTSLAFLLLVGTPLAANAQYGNRGDNGPGCGQAECEQNEWRDQHRQEKFEIAGDLIGLSEEQQEQIADIREEARSEHRVLQEKIRGYHEQIMELTDAGIFDEKSIRTIATEKAEIQVEMAVAKARVHSKIFGLMTPEQQKIAEKLRAFRQDSQGKSRRGGCGGRV